MLLIKLIVKKPNTVIVIKVIKTRIIIITINLLMILVIALKIKKVGK